MNLSTKYLGLQLANPLVAAASPLTRDLGEVRLLEDAGIGALVMYSLFEEELDLEEEALEFCRVAGTNAYAESLDFFPMTGNYTRGAEEYLEQLRRIKDAVDVPVIASLNGASPGGWTSHAAQLQEAGADAIELNIYHLSADPGVSASELEARYLEIVQEVVSKVSIPVAVKLGPFFSSLGNFAAALQTVGAGGLVLFNRFYQPDIDLETLEVKPRVVLSNSHEARLATRWIALLRPHLECSLAATGGIHTPEDIAKLLLVGADVTMLCSTLLANGIGHVTELLGGLVRWGEEAEYESVEQLRGSMSHARCPTPEAFERANYMKTLQSWGTP